MTADPRDAQQPQTATGFDKFYDDYDRGTWCISAVDGQNFIVGDVLIDGLTTKQADDALRALAEAIAIGARQERERLVAWHAQVREDWRQYWQGKDHRYGRDFAAFLGERLRNDYRLPEPDDHFIPEPEAGS